MRNIISIRHLVAALVDADAADNVPVGEQVLEEVHLSLGSAQGVLDGGFARDDDEHPVGTVVDSEDPFDERAGESVAVAGAAAVPGIAAARWKLLVYVVADEAAHAADRTLVIPAYNAADKVVALQCAAHAEVGELIHGLVHAGGELDCVAVHGLFARHVVVQSVDEQSVGLDAARAPCFAGFRQIVGAVFDDGRIAQ